MTRADVSQTAGLELLAFEVGGVRLALELTVVREVVRAVLITPLPGAPPVIEGVIDVRGEILPVYDVRRRFGLSPAPLDPDQRLVLAWTGDRLVALRCDRTEWIESADASVIASAAPLLHGDRRIAGVARLPSGLVLVQNLAEFIDQAERATLEEALVARNRDR